jgi:glycosyltransferase involved in cell wall biosynthesis
MSPITPRVTFALITFNQARYIRGAIRGALAQTYSPLEILISDDRSTDDTFDIAGEAVSNYRGPHRIVLNRNETNLGIGGHINRLMALATGDLIVAAAGDDISLPHRVESLVAHFDRYPKCYSAYSNMMVMDAAGQLQKTWLTEGQAPPALSLEAYVTRGEGVFGCTHAWRRDVFDQFGPLDDRVMHEDCAIPFRSALLGEVHYLDDVLVQYRRHGDNAYKGRDQLAHAAELRGNRRRLAEDQIGRYSTMVSDLSIRIDRVPGEAARLQHLMRLAGRARSFAMIEAELLQQSSLLGKMGIMCTGLRSGAGFRRLAKWALVEWFPSIYLARLRSKG